MIFKDIQVNSKIDLLRVGTQKILRKVYEQDFHAYQVGQRELIASMPESKCYKISDFYMAPFCDIKTGEVLGTQLMLTNRDFKAKN